MSGERVTYAASEQIVWVWFDICGVLVELDEEGFFDNWSVKLGIGSDVVRKLLRSKQILQFETGYRSAQEVFDWIVQKYSVKDLDFESFKHYWCAYVSRCEPALESMALLAPYFMIGLASNIDPLFFARVKELCPEIGLAKQQVVSHEVGFLKPQQDFFAEMIACAGYPPDRCLLIDDDPINVLEAAKTGLRVITAKPCSTLDWRSITYRLLAKLPGGT